MICLEESSTDYTDLVVPWGNFRFNVLPFGKKIGLPYSRLLLEIAVSVYRLYSDTLNTTKLISSQPLIKLR